MIFLDETTKKGAFVPAFFSTSTFNTYLSLVSAVVILKNSSFSSFVEAPEISKIALVPLLTIVGFVYKESY